MAEALFPINGKHGVHLLSRLNHHHPSLPHKPMMITMSRDQSYLAAINADIEANLKQVIPVRPPLSVFEPMHHLVFAAPRTTAPALCIAACELVGGHQDQAMAAASAIHLMYAAAYAHEHLQLTDKPKPSSRPTIDHVYSPNIELLTGDGILPFGYELLARSNDPTRNNSEQILRVTIEITRAMGSQGMVEGQYHKIEHKSDGEELSDMRMIFDQVARKKEGGLHACGAACGAILGGANEEEILKLRKYGAYVGMIQGLLANECEGKEKEMRKRVEEIRVLAIKELEVFKGGKFDAISSFLDV